MSIQDQRRLGDIRKSIDAIQSHLGHGDLNNGLVFDAIRIRMLEIGEAVKAISPELRATQKGIAWGEIARMRDHLAHRYFDAAHATLQSIIDHDLSDLSRAVDLMLTEMADEGDARRSPPPN